MHTWDKNTFSTGLVGKDSSSLSSTDESWITSLSVHLSCTADSWGSARRRCSWLDLANLNKYENGRQHRYAKSIIEADKWRRPPRAPSNDCIQRVHRICRGHFRTSRAQFSYTAWGWYPWILHRYAHWIFFRLTITAVAFSWMTNVPFEGCFLRLTITTVAFSWVTGVLLERRFFLGLIFLNLSGFGWITFIYRWHILHVALPLAYLSPIQNLLSCQGLRFL